MVKTEEIWLMLEEVSDPEIPVLSVLDLGVVRSIVFENEVLTIALSPTYSGCPAMNTIAADIKNLLFTKGFEHVSIKNQLSPAWTTDWISEKGREKLLEYGIAPPVNPINNSKALFGTQPIVNCPLCTSKNTEMISLFGSTACKALYKCLDCLEPFDYFKCLK